MQILVLGGTGFIGSHLVEALIKAEHNITVLDRTLKHTIEHQNVRYIESDFANRSIFDTILPGIDLVIHLISTTGPQSSNADPIFDTQSNLINTLQLLQAMHEAKTTRLIYFSSGGTVYGNPTKLPIKETAPTKPLCSYGITKLAIEHHIQMHQTLHGLNATIIRPSNPYGPRQGHIGSQGVISTFTNQINKGLPIKVWGDGSVIRDYIYITDLISACLKLIESNNNGIFNIGCGYGTPINEIISTIELVLEKKANVIYENKRGFDIKEIVLDIKRIKECLNWQPTTKLEHGINNYCSWLSQ